MRHTAYCRLFPLIEIIRVVGETVSSRRELKISFQVRSPIGSSGSCSPFLGTASRAGEAAFQEMATAEVLGMFPETTLFFRFIDEEDAECRGGVCRGMLLVCW